MTKVKTLLESCFDLTDNGKHCFKIVAMPE